MRENWVNKENEEHSTRFPFIVVKRVGGLTAATVVGVGVDSKIVRAVQQESIGVKCEYDYSWVKPAFTMIEHNVRSVTK